MHTFRQLRGLVFILVTVTLISACGQAATQEPSAASLMPNLPDYYVNDTVNIQDAISKVASLTSLGAAHPELAGLIAGINNLLTCYQNAGAIQGRTYVNKADVFKAGIVVIVNRNAVSDPATFINCVVPPSARSLLPQVQPCAKAYTLNTANNQYYIGYAATDPGVCQAFCAALQGCTP
jgi:hypothetical protein